MDDELFTDDAVIRSVSREPVMIAAAGRALLLQLAHPKVCQGVAEHSGFEASPIPRLLATLDYLGILIFGTRGEAERVAAKVRRTHDFVKGADYSAHDPNLLCWVYATLFDSAMDFHGRIFGPLPVERAERFYTEYATVATMIGCPPTALPPDLAAFRDYWRHMIDTLEVTDDARRLAHAILYPRLVPVITGPAEYIHRVFTIGLLPPEIRDRYGLRGWPRVLGFLLALARLGAQLTPRFARHLPSRLAVPVVRRLRWSKVNAG